MSETFTIRLLIFVLSATLFAFSAFYALPAIFTDTSQWKTVEGTLVESAVWTDEIRVKYEYQVDGRTYVGSQVSLWTESWPTSMARDPDREWVEGRRVLVYHHPADPARAVLDPAVGTSHKVLVVFATLLTAAGVIGAFLPGPGSRPRRRRTCR